MQCKTRNFSVDDDRVAIVNSMKSVVAKNLDIKYYTGEINVYRNWYRKILQ